jgi:hypothetical protein
MVDMSKNIHLYVCHPDVGITKSLEVVFVQLELMRNLQHLQTRFDLTPAEDGPIEAEGGGRSN